MKILVVDDDDLLVEQLSADLLAQNYVVDTASDGLLGWDYATATTYDLIVLDINLPGLDGVSLCQRLRQGGYAGAILLLTGRSSSNDKVMGLNAGADDYLVKPYTLAELMARLRALLRRPQLVSSPTLRYGSLRLDPNGSLVTVADRPVELSPKEYGLLELFLRHPDHIFSNTLLLERLWSVEEAPGEETIRTHIKRLRRKLKQAGIDDMIENVYGMGYRLRPAAIGDPIGDAAPPPDETDKAVAAREAAIAAFDRFRPTIEERMAALRAAALALESNHLPAAVQTAAQGAAHKLAGSLGLFGYGAGSHLARRLEDWLDQPDLTQGQTFSRLVDQLDGLLRSPPVATATESQAAIVPLPPAAALGDRIAVVAVDNDPMILAQLQSLLPPWGVDVLGLQDPRQALATLEASPPDLLLLDLDMLPLSGLDLCRQLRQIDRWQTLPIVCLTACCDAATLYELYQAGADDYLPKPVIEPELVSRIFHRVERGRLLQTLAGVDPRSGLANRQKGTIELNLLLALAQRQGEIVTLLVIQLNPKNLPGGGTPSRSLGQSLTELLGPGDVLACWGPNELIVGLWATDRAAAQALVGQTLQLPLMDKLSSSSDALGTLSRIDATVNATPMNATKIDAITVGTATFPVDGQTLPLLYRQAQCPIARLSLSP
ncbi:MAG: response regulator [Nodosilinea sp.]